jgi:hypothetical protein
LSSTESEVLTVFWDVTCYVVQKKFTDFMKKNMHGHRREGMQARHLPSPPGFLEKAQN